MALILLASGLPPATVFAQEVGPPANSETNTPPPADAIGPPQLRGFDLRGSEVVPARPQAAPQPSPPTVTTPAPKVTAPIEVRPEPETAPSMAEPTMAQRPAPTRVDEQPRPAGTAPATETPAPLPTLPETAPAPLPPPQIEEPAPTGFAFSWIYLVGVAMAAGLLGLWLWSRRRKYGEERLAYQIVDGGEAATDFVAPRAPPLRRAEPEADPPRRPERSPVPEPTASKRDEVDPPAFLVRSASVGTEPKGRPGPIQPAVSAPVRDGVVGIQIRPWLRLEFRPDRATTTLTEAAVQFELIIANTGNEVATNVRVDARMFNAGPQLEQEIEAYFAAPVRERASGMIPAIAPRNATSMRSVVAIPKEQVREIEVQGRRLFIPTVAITVRYEWGSGKAGRTSMSFLVGREPENPSSKMSPFRLDQGPRIYRQLGQRPGQPAVLV